jgi:hypothetical protein
MHMHPSQRNDNCVLTNQHSNHRAPTPFYALHTSLKLPTNASRQARHVSHGTTISHTLDTTHTCSRGSSGMIFSRVLCAVATAEVLG